MLNATVGQILVNETLPEEMRDYNRVLDKKGMHSLLQEVARKHPDKYREVSFKLNQIGQRAAQDQGGMSFGMQHLRRSKAANAVRRKIQANIERILEDDSLNDKERADRIVRVVGKEMSPQQKAILEEAIENKNPLAMQVLSGSRGKPMNLASLLGSDMLYSDHRDEVIPIPVLRSYAEGLTPEEYWAGTYGARRGIIATKFATQEAGFLSKQLNQAGHRLVVEDEEGDDNPDRGMVVDVDDMDNEGALLARDLGPYKRNTPLTPKILKHLKRLGKNRILIRSPLVGGSPAGGVYARDVGVRETGKLPGRGEQVGLQAAQALSEPISQGQLSAKHSGGVAGEEKAVGGFQYINQLIQVPQKMQGGAAHAELDGTVQRVEEAPQGGHYVTVNDQKHYVGEGFKLKVKKGDEVEAGDLISDGIPNPALIVKHKGVGEGRRYFVNEFRKAMESSGMRGHRRNIELLARGLINHVQLTEETDDNAPDDIVPYSTFEHTYKPREGHQLLGPKKALGQYLERPVLHYTIGTKIRPSMLKDFEEFGINEVTVHKEPPPFQPHMVRGMYQLQHDPDWMTQMYGSGLKKSLLTSTARGATSKERGTSFVPSLAKGTDFGQDPTRSVIKPQPGYELPKVEQPKPEEPPKPEPAGSTFFGGRFKVGMHKQAEKPQGFPGGASDPKPGKMPNLGGPLGAPATQPLAAPTAPTPAPSGVADMNIMPTQTGAPAGDPLHYRPKPAPFGMKGQITDQEIDVAYNAVAQEPAKPTPPPSTPAQERADSIQESRSRNYNTESALANPSIAASVGKSLQGQNPLSSLFMLGGFADPEAMRQYTAGTPSRNLAGNRMMRGMRLDQARNEAMTQARQRTQQMRMQNAAQHNTGGIDPSLIDSQPSPSDRVIPQQEPASPSDMPVPSSPTAGKGNEFGFGLGGNDIVRWGIGAGLEKAVTPRATAEAAKKAPWLARLAQGGKQMVVPGANIARGSGGLAGGGAGGGAGAAAGAGALPALGGFVAVNAIGELVDAAGLLPQWAGGTGTVFTEGTDAFGWDQSGYERDTMANTGSVGGYLANSGKAVMNPLKAIGEIWKGQYEVGKAGIGKAYDLATWSTPESRNVEKIKNEVQQMQQEKQESLSAQKEQIEHTLETNKTMSPTQRQQLQQQHEELDAQIRDSQIYAESMDDETADWELGKQHVFGGGHYFRDAIEGTGNRLKAKIQKLEESKNTMSRAELLDLENMKARQRETERLKMHYDREVGYFGEGEFDKMIRVRVKSMKQQMVELGKRMREPAVRANPELMEELQADLRHVNQRLTNYRGWARQAEEQKVRK